MPTKDPFASADRLAKLDRVLTRVAAMELPTVPPSGWLKTVRQALGMSAPAVGRRLNMTGPAVRRSESSEQSGAISVQTLERIAGAMDCELLYVLVPRTPLGRQVRQRAEELVAAEMGLTHLGQNQPSTGQSDQLDDEFEVAVRRLVHGPRRRFW